MHSTEPLWFSSEVLTKVVSLLEEGGHGGKRVLRSLWLKEKPGPGAGQAFAPNPLPPRTASSWDPTVPSSTSGFPLNEVLKT